MKDEIKEILDFIDDRVIPNEKWDKVKDYITNLQEENERLKEELQQEKKDFKEANDYCFELKDYKQRNEKAIELLEHFDSGQQCEHTKDLAIIVEKILQGDDKDERN